MPCWGPFIEAQRNEKQPVVSYSITKINMEQTEFISVGKILNREECVQEGAVVNFKGSEDFLKTIPQIISIILL